MDKYDRLDSIGEEHLLSLMKVQNPRTMIGLSDQIVFNENDSFSLITGEVILFHLDDGSNTFSVMILPNNTFKVLYYVTDDEDDGNYIFTFNNVPYDITEEWHFQKSTQKRLPFTYEFHEKMKEFVEYCLKLI
ncbi:hypothetical protein FDG95_gp525 [Pectobacterium phage vB_PcaM_CBB]|uniref:Uncharacterized protein n=1 Tax=Pectobacterium phage vB_PcaM_CBB TaxID=2772511 RepID=A0A1L2CVJ5_9CAUD|nr:hypothetical protein FDG95_gp525 [Pectobacterium phage vB_PcaM_CBB]AMM44017.1 hypothetical protein CBB_454 [Pectobacterium phage vB_PcaM_CBB]